MAETSGGPFDGDRPAVHLHAAPLVRVLCQVQWPEQTVLTTGFSQVADEIGLSIAEIYPLSSSPQGMSFEFDPATAQMRPQANPLSRQWSSIDDVWWVYFTPNFVTLENRGRYTTREDMIGRMQVILTSVEQFAHLPAAQRVGWRYVNRLSDPEDIDDIEQLVQPTVLGARAIPAPPEVQLEHSFNDALFKSAEASLIAKWGFLPPNVAYDQNIALASSQSWILDLDAFRDSRMPFDVATLSQHVAELSSFAYTFFRWAVKDEFIRRFGGEK